MYKPGYRTSEFWFTLVSFIFSGLFLLGIIGDPEQKEELISNVTHAVESCILIGGQLMILYKYLKSRSTVKTAYFNSKTSTPPTPTPKPLEDTNVKSRTNKNRSRKTNSASKTKPKSSKKNSNS